MKEQYDARRSELIAISGLRKFLSHPVIALSKFGLIKFTRMTHRRLVVVVLVVLLLPTFVRKTHRQGSTSLIGKQTTLSQIETTLNANLSLAAR